MELWKRCAKEAQLFCKDLCTELVDIDAVMRDILDPKRPVFGVDTVLSGTDTDSKCESQHQHAEQKRLLLERDVEVRRVYEETVGKGLVSDVVFWDRLFFVRILAMFHGHKSCGNKVEKRVKGFFPCKAQKVI